MLLQHATFLKKYANVYFCHRSKKTAGTKVYSHLVEELDAVKGKEKGYNEEAERLTKENTLLQKKLQNRTEHLTFMEETLQEVCYSSCIAHFIAFLETTIYSIIMVIVRIIAIKNHE